ncbi:MAG: T9SS type A sorting domain-containing protein [Bacteroidota bacterium]
MQQLRVLICFVFLITLFQLQSAQAQSAPSDISYIIGGGGSFGSDNNAEFAMAINPGSTFPAIPAAAELTVIMYIPTSQVTGSEVFTILDDATNGGSINYQAPGFAYTDGNTYFSFVYSGTGIDLSTFGSGNFELIFSVDVANGTPSAVWTIADGTTALFTDFNIRSALNVSGFNELTLTANAPLPVELVYFQATAVDDQSLLTWQTATELDNAGFDIQHSLNGRDWNTLDFVEGQGTTDLFNDYRYFHQEPKSGSNYYRLKQIDYDGEYEYSAIKVVQRLGTALEVKVFPNPVSEVLNVEVQMNYKEGNYQLFNMAGQLVRSNVLIGENLTQVGLGDLPKGSYILQVQVDGAKEVRNILVQ